MSKFFEISYTVSQPEGDLEQPPVDLPPLFAQVALTDVSGQEDCSDHELHIDLYHGTMNEDGKGLAVAHNRYMIFSDDFSEFGLEDSKGNQDFPIFLVHAESVLNGKIEGIHNTEILIQMGKNMADVHDVLANIMTTFHHNQKAFLHGANSVFEQMDAGEDIEGLLNEMVAQELPDILDPLVTFYIAARHKDPDRVTHFKDFFARLQALMDKNNKKVDMRLVE